MTRDEPAAIPGPTPSLDHDAFAALVQSRLGSGPGAVRFAHGQRIAIARAPGRLDVMGGIADYSGSLVLQLPLAAAAFAAVQRVPERTLTIESVGGEASGRAPDLTVGLDRLLGCDHAAARELLTKDPRRRWTAYVAGALLVLAREHGASFPDGAKILLASSVPEGKGLASSAAIEVAAMRALAEAFAVRLEPRALALACQRVENAIAGAPCGVMDQMTAACGRAGHLLALRCQPAEVEGLVAVPPGLAFLAIDSGVRHAISGSDYAAVRAGAFMGYRILADLVGLLVEPRGEIVAVHDPRWHGYLANIDPHELEHLVHALPVRMTGRDFLARYGGTTDPWTRIDPERTYAVRVPTAHPIHENARVHAFRALLQGPCAETDRLALGELMYQSHASMSACGLGSEATDRLVEQVQAAPPEAGLYGAKVTGGGCGGTVAVLIRSS